MLSSLYMLNIKFQNTRKNLFWQIIFCAPRMLDGLDLTEIIIWMGLTLTLTFPTDIS